MNNSEEFMSLHDIADQGEKDDFKVLIGTQPKNIEQGWSQIYSQPKYEEDWDFFNDVKQPINIFYPMDRFQEEEQNEEEIEQEQFGEEIRQGVNDNFSQCFSEEINDIIINPMVNSQETLVPFEFKDLLLKQIQKDAQEKNTPRFLMRILLVRLKEYFCFYTTSQISLLEAKIAELEARVKMNKKAVFLVKDLNDFLNNPSLFGQQTCRMNRRFFSEILRKYTIEEMSRPKSQIKKNRIRYLRTAKVYNLRCRSKFLVQRNQSQ